MIDLSPLAPSGRWQGFDPPTPPPDLADAFRASWALNFYSPHYVTGRGYFDRTRIPVAGAWYEVLGTAEVLRGLSRSDQDDLVIRHAQWISARGWRGGGTKLPDLSGIDFNI